MSEQRRMILALLLSVLVLLVWEMFYGIGGPPAERTGKQSDSVSSAGGENGSVRGEARDLIKLSSDLGLKGVANIAAEKREVLRIQNEYVEGEINLSGGLLDSLSLLEYRESLDKESNAIEVLQPATKEKSSYIGYGWLSADTEVPSNESKWVAVDKNTISWTNSTGVEFLLRFKSDERYMFSVEQEVRNGGGTDIEVRPYGYLRRQGKHDSESGYISHEGYIGVFDEKLEEKSYAKVMDKGKVEYEGESSWFGFTDKYWLTAMILRDAHKVSYRGIEEQTIHQADYLYEGRVLGRGVVERWTTYLFVGAKETSLLDYYKDKYNIAYFDKAVDFGWLYFLTKPIFQLLSLINGKVGNFGVAILLLTVIVKTIFFPLAFKSYVSISKMRLLQPKVEELKESIGDDRQEMSRAMMKLYREEKVNPLSGCLPIVIQLPVFFALYKVLYVTIEMRHSPFFGWVKDLSVKDPTGIFTLFGLVEWSVPDILGILNIGLWPIMMGISMWLQQRLQPKPTDKVQAQIFMLLPFVFTFVLGTFPAGLVIYWTWNNVLSIIQQTAITRYITHRKS